MNAIILSIGDELVLGQTVDTNSAWLSRELAAVGVPVLAHVTVSDDQSAIESAIREAVERVELVLITGGLGPTDDDLTRQALAAVLGVPLELDLAALENVQRIFQQMKRPMAERNRIQAMLPRGTRMIENTNGTAPGIAIEGSGVRVQGSGVQGSGFGVQGSGFGVQGSGGSGFFGLYVMPGVPAEMKLMFARSILPELKAFAGGAVILSRTLHTFGLGESLVADRLGLLMDRRRNPSVGTTVSGGIVSLRINARFGSRDEAQRELEQTDRACREALGEIIFGADEETLPRVVGGMLRSAKQTVATAESCTGGLLAKLLTDVSGSSGYFRYGWITYANEAKTDLLDVPADLIARHGAVSEDVAVCMAGGAAARARADYALAISGIAGPEGGSEEKPVGTVCIALAVAAHSDGQNEERRLTSRTFHFAGDREMIRLRSAYMGLTMLRFELLGRGMPF